MPEELVRVAIEDSMRSDRCGVSELRIVRDRLILRPLFSVTPIEEGTTYDLVVALCHPAEVVWSRNGDVITNDGVFKITEEEQMVHKLRICAAKKGLTDGTISCVVNEEETSTLVRVKPPTPKMLLRPPTEMTVNSGEDILLEFQFSHPLSDLLWKRGGRILSQSHRIDVQDEGRIQRLRVRQATPTDSGSFCVELPSGEVLQTAVDVKRKFTPIYCIAVAI